MRYKEIIQEVCLFKNDHGIKIYKNPSRREFETIFEKSNTRYPNQFFKKHNITDLTDYNIFKTAKKHSDDYSNALERWQNTLASKASPYLHEVENVIRGIVFENNIYIWDAYYADHGHGSEVITGDYNITLPFTINQNKELATPKKYIDTFQQNKVIQSWQLTKISSEGY